jgi:nitrite reductase/ring-hydroxylating ferredoxin subunit
MSSKLGFKKVANKRDFQKGNLLRVEPDGKPIVLSEVDSKIYAMDAICTHEGAPLEEGNLEQYSLICPWHYAVFDVRNGKVSDATVWATDLKSYPVEVEDDTGDILVNPDVTDDKTIL